MGNKLGKMVKLKNIICILTISLPLFADLLPIYKKDFEQNSYSLDVEKNAQLFSISGNRLGISIKDISIGKPSAIAIKILGEVFFFSLDSHEIFIVTNKSILSMEIFFIL